MSLLRHLKVRGSRRPRPEQESKGRFIAAWRTFQRAELFGIEVEIGTDGADKSRSFMYGSIRPVLMGREAESSEPTRTV